MELERSDHSSLLVEPSDEVRFTLIPKNNTFSNICLTNKGLSKLIFRVTSNSPENYIIFPTYGFLGIAEMKNIKIFLKCSRLAIKERKKDFFTIDTCEFDPNNFEEGKKDNFWENEQVRLRKGFSTKNLTIKINLLEEIRASLSNSKQELSPLLKRKESKGDKFLNEDIMVSSLKTDNKENIDNSYPPLTPKKQPQTSRLIYISPIHTMNEINQSFSKIKHNSSHLSLLSPSSPPSPSSQQNPPFSFSHPSSSIPILSILPPLPNQPSSISHPPYSLPTLPHILNPPSFSSNPTCCSHLASPLLFPSYSSPIFNERRTQMDRMIEIFQQNEKKIEEESKQLEKLRRELQIENQRKNKYEEIKLQNETYFWTFIGLNAICVILGSIFAKS